MASKSMQRRPRFNPTEYKEEFIDLMKSNPELAADSATKLARRKVNAEMAVADSDHATKGLVALFGTLLVMGGAGWWNGRIKAKRDALIADWEVAGAESVGADTSQTPEPWHHERGVSDPCCWWYVPKLLVLPVATGLAAVIAASMRGAREDPGYFERTMTMSAGATFGYVVANMVSGWSYKRKEQQIAKMTAADVSSIKPAPPAAA